jgi:hypothetical protein
MIPRRPSSLTLWLCLGYVTLGQVTSFIPMTTTNVPKVSTNNVHRNQDSGDYSSVLTSPASMRSNHRHSQSSKSQRPLYMVSIQNVIATALHHDPEDHHVMMAGSLWPVLQKIFTAPMKFRLIVHNIVSITEWQECILLPLLAFGVTPLAKLIYRVSGENDRKMDDMKRFGIVSLIDQVSKVALSVYVMDVISITMSSIGFTFAKEWRIAEVYAKFACTYTSMFEVLTVLNLQCKQVLTFFTNPPLCRYRLCRSAIFIV